MNKPDINVEPCYSSGSCETCGGYSYNRITITDYKEPTK